MPIVTPATAKRVYRPELLERPSMAKFVVLSLLMHIWAVALLGDESDGSSAGTGAKRGWVSSFTAKINAASTPNIAKAAASAGAALGKTPTPSPTATSEPPTNLTNSPTDTNASADPASAQAAVAPDIAPIAVIAVETTNPQSDFVIPSVSLAPLASPQSTDTPNFAAILMPPLSTNPSVNSGRGDFAIYVPPISKADTEAPIVAADKALAIAPIVMPAQAASTALATKTFDTFKPAANIEPAQALPILPIEKIALPTNAVGEFAPSPAVILQNQAPVFPAQVPAPATRLDPTPILSPAPALTPTAAAPLAPPPVTTTAAAKLTAVGEVTGATNAATTTNPAEQNTKTDKGVSDSSRSTATSVAQSNAVADTSAAGASASLNQSTLLPIIPTQPLPLTATPSPTLDLDKLRQRARDIGSLDKGSRLLNPFPTVAKPADKREIEKIFDKALKRPDCKDEYADMGLAAVVPLVRDVIKGNGCKW